MRLSGAAIDMPPAALAAGSSTPPSQASRCTMAARIAGEFSPMPAVNTKASRPPSAAASRPALQGDPVDEVVEREARARIFALASSSRTSLLMPDRPFSPHLVIEEVLNLLGAHLLFPDQVEHHAGIDLAGPRAHRQARRAR